MEIKTRFILKILNYHIQQNTIFQVLFSWNEKRPLTSTISLFSSFPILYLKHESGLGVNFSSNGCPITATKTWNNVDSASLKIPCLGLHVLFYTRILPLFTYIIIRVIGTHLIHIVIEQSDFLEQHGEMLNLLRDLCPPLRGHLDTTVDAIR